jgi:hypothetical protein
VRLVTSPVVRLEGPLAQRAHSTQGFSKVWPSTGACEVFVWHRAPHRDRCRDMWRARSTSRPVSTCQRYAVRRRRVNLGAQWGAHPVGRVAGSARTRRVGGDTPRRLWIGGQTCGQPVDPPARGLLASWFPGAAARTSPGIEPGARYGQGARSGGYRGHEVRRTGQPAVGHLGALHNLWTKVWSAVGFAVPESSWQDQDGRPPPARVASVEAHIAWMLDSNEPDRIG